MLRNWRGRSWYCGRGKPESVTGLRGGKRPRRQPKASAPPNSLAIQSGPMAVSPARAWSIAGLLFVAGFINYLDRAIVSVALPVIAADLHLGPTAKDRKST